MLQHLLNRLRGVNDDERGFTLIELLVVILIIGILAAIALPVFLGQQQKGQDSSAKSDARNAVTQVESCLVDAVAYTECNVYTGKPTTVTVTLTSDDAYTVVAESKSTRTFTIAKTGVGTFPRSCNSPSEGGCNASSSW